MGWFSSPGLISSTPVCSFVNFTYLETFPSAIWSHKTQETSV
jgi:hypothetical protein